MKKEGLVMKEKKPFGIIFNEDPTHFIYTRHALNIPVDLK